MATVPRDMGGRILVVDDSEIARRTVAEVLRRGGFEVLEAENGSVALRLASGRELDLIVADINMPGMGGLQMMAAIRQQPQHSSTPFMVLSAESPPPSHQDARLCVWITKPIPPAELLVAVNQMLDQQPPRRPPSPTNGPQVE